MSAAQIVLPAGWNRISSHWSFLLPVAHEYLAANPDAVRCLIARHKITGRWAVTDPEQNPAYWSDPAWHLTIVVTRDAVTRGTRTPRSWARWHYTRGVWHLAPWQVGTCAAWVDLVAGDYVVTAEDGTVRPMFTMLTDGVPA